MTVCMGCLLRYEVEEEAEVHLLRVHDDLEDGDDEIRRLMLEDDTNRNPTHKPTLPFPFASHRSMGFSAKSSAHSTLHQPQPHRFVEED